MSLGWLILSVLGFFLALLLFVPFFFTINTEQKFFRVRWHLFDFSADFSNKTYAIGFAGLHYRKKKRAEPSTDSPPVEETEKEEKKGEEAAGPGLSSILSIIFARRALAIDIIRKTIRYVIDLLQAFSITRIQIDFSAADPVINGICYGALQGIQIRRVHLGVNFWGTNRFIGRFALPLYRLILPTTLFLIRIPYVQIYRVVQEIRHQAPAEQAKEEIAT